MTTASILHVAACAPAWRPPGAAYVWAGRVKEALTASHAARPVSGPNADVVFSGLVHATAGAAHRWPWVSP